VLLDESLAAMYSVSTRALNQAVSRNRKRFPRDFMFQLTVAEAAGTVPMSSLNKVLQCCLPFCEAIVPLQSTSRLCERSCHCVASLDHTQISRRS
jgi:hypothetical protein